MSKGKKFQPAGVGMTPAKTELGKFIRARRLELDLKQVPLAELSGFSQNLVSMFEVGTCKHLNPKKLERLAKALQCDPEELQRRIPVKHVAEPTTKLGKFIRSRREELGLTLGDLAKKLAMTLQQAKRLEVRKNPSLSYGFVKPLASALNLDPSVFGEFLGRVQKPTKSKLGQLVRRRRKELAMSSMELAKKLGVSSQLVSHIELGKCRLSESDELVERLAHVLKLDLGELQAVRPQRRRKQTMAMPTPLGGFLAARRLELRLTQRELEKLANIGVNVISGVERGRLHPSPSFLDKLAKALDCEIPPELIPPPREHVWGKELRATR